MSKESMNNLGSLVLVGVSNRNGNVRMSSKYNKFD